MPRFSVLRGYRLFLGMLMGAVGVVGIPLQAVAGSFTPPSGLMPGSFYRLVFVTSGTFQATSPDITTYNSDVTSAAAGNSALPIATWAAIASTASIDAVANAACSQAGCAVDPLFMVNGVEVAATLADFFAGTVYNSISVTEGGSSINGSVWTGSNGNGTGASGYTLGTSSPETGITPDYAGNGLDSASFSSANSSFFLYAISAPIQAPAVSEPASAPLMAVGCALLAALAVRRRRTKS